MFQKVPPDAGLSRIRACAPQKRFRRKNCGGAGSAATSATAAATAAAALVDAIAAVAAVEAAKAPAGRLARPSVAFHTHLPKSAP